MNIRNARSVVVGIVAVAAVAGALASGVKSRWADGGGGSQEAGSASAVGAALSSRPVVEAGPIARPMLDRLDRSGIDLDGPLEPAGLRGYAAALESASRFARALGGSAGPSGAALMRVTVRNYGTEVASEPNQPSQVVLAIKDRPAWVMVYEKVPAPVSSGGYTDDSKEQAARDAFKAKLTATVAVVVDARTGEFLTASTI